MKKTSALSALSVVKTPMSEANEKKPPHTPSKGLSQSKITYSTCAEKRLSNKIKKASTEERLGMRMRIFNVFGYLSKKNRKAIISKSST